MKQRKKTKKEEDKEDDNGHHDGDHIQNQVCPKSARNSAPF